MKKEYLAPKAREIRLLAEDLMGPSQLLQPGGNSFAGGDDDTTEMIPLDVFGNN